MRFGHQLRGYGGVTLRSAASTPEGRMRRSSLGERPAVEAFGRTNRGSREDNQDAILVASPWFAVADGVGGHADGAAASAAAIAAVRSYVGHEPSATAVVDAVLDAHAAVQALGDASSGDRRPATTLTVAGLSNDGRKRTVEFAHAGDSRGYVISAGRITQITADHSLVDELVRAGRLEPEQAQRHPMRNVVTRVCGQQGLLDVDHYSVPVSAGDFVLLVSDGIPVHLSDADMHFLVDNSRYLIDVPSTVEWAAGALVAHALGRGGSDNASVVLVQVA
jgi:protein phosphatase